MGTGYTRNDTLNNIADGNIINASDLDGEFDAVQAAFNESTGHTHDGTAAEGAPITVLGPVQDFIASATEIKPKTTNTLDIGTLSLQFKDMYLDGTAYIDGLGEDILVATDKKVQFRDTALFINSSVDGQLDIDADVELELVAPTVDIDASTAVTIDTATLTITGSANVTGDLDVDNININGNTISSTDTNGNITLAPNGTGVVALSSTDLTFGDNDKAIFGAGSDLQIYHDGTASWIEDAGTGYLKIASDGAGILLQKSASETMAQFLTDGAVNLFYDNSQKLATTSTGVDVTGTVVTDGFELNTLAIGGDTFGTVKSANNTAAGFDFFGDSSGTKGARVYYEGNGNLFTIAENTSGTIEPRLVIDDSGNVGIGTTSPNVALDVVGEATVGNGTYGVKLSYSGGNTSGIIDTANSANTLEFRIANSEKMRIDSSGNVGIGTSPSSLLHIQGQAATLTIQDADTSGTTGIEFQDSAATVDAKISVGNSTQYMAFETAGAEAARFDSTGNLLVGKTATGSGTAGVEVKSDGALYATRTLTTATPVGIFNRLSTDGEIVSFRKDSTVVGTMGSNSGTYLYIGTSGVSPAFFRFVAGSVPSVRPATYTGSNYDNGLDLGAGSARFDDVYATNGTIQTSDANEKQQIAALTDAEMTAAKSISALFKTFKWNSAVEAKGDAARTHAGVIAQDVEAAMTAAGLDAGDYAFFISSTWWETQTEVPAVEAVDAVLDEDGNVVTEAVEAVAAYTRIDTYDTAEEAPEGATERTRLGVRYPELLAFIGAATEQRLANIETRLAALEAN